MIQVKFRNLDRSDIVESAVLERIEALADKFEGLKQSRIVVSLEMENSPTQAGPDLFNVKIFISRGRYDGIKVRKSNLNLYRALAEVVDHMLEVLNRFGDKERVKQRAKERKFANQKIALSQDDTEVF